MKLVSYNVGLVNPEAAMLNVDGLVADLLAMEADVVALHEFEARMCPRLDEALMRTYGYSHYLTLADDGYSCALFSRLPMENVVELQLDADSEDARRLQQLEVTPEGATEAWKRGVIAATIYKADGSKVRVITCHLMSNGFNQLLIYDGLSPFKRFPLFWRRYRMSCEGRDIESRYVRALAEKAFASGMEVIVCGDTNSFWWSRTIRGLVRGFSSGGFIGSSAMPSNENRLVMRDAFEGNCWGIGILKRWASPLGYGHTLYTHRVMYFRLDYVLYSTGLRLRSYRVPHLKHSDHYPLVVEFV